MPKDRKGKRYPSDDSLEYRKYRTDWEKGKSARAKLAVVSGYGGKCTCCGEARLVFLEIDHVDNDAKQRVLRGEPRRGANLYKWLLKNELPNGFQVLCRNCNWGKWIYGVCPHVIDRS